MIPHSVQTLQTLTLIKLMLVLKNTTGCIYYRFLKMKRQNRDMIKLLLIILKLVFYYMCILNWTGHFFQLKGLLFDTSSAFFPFYFSRMHRKNGQFASLREGSVSSNSEAKNSLVGNTLGPETEWVMLIFGSNFQFMLNVLMDSA